MDVVTCWGEGEEILRETRSLKGLPEQKEQKHGANLVDREGDVIGWEIGERFM